MSIKLRILLVINCFIFSISLYSQTLSINGKITSSRFPVKDAVVTFIDNSDTTKKYTTLTDNSGNYKIDILTSVIDNPNEIPNDFILGQNYPNPFSTSTSIPYGLNKESDVQITIYDILGRVVRKFNFGLQSRGIYNIVWDGRNNFGQKVANGIYFYKLDAGGESQVKKMIFTQNANGLMPLNYSFSMKNIDFNNLSKSFQSTSYKVRIQNGENTTPIIVPLEYDKIVINRDTTINFSVNYITTLSINPEKTYQIIRGFGAANIVQWRPDMTDSEIETAFGTGEGQLGFTILRIRIQPDSNLWYTNVSTAKKAYEKGAIIIASPWSPPASMKTNNNLVGGELREDAYDDYAKHLNAFVKYMENQGVPIYAVSIQNEPDIKVTYESCDWTPEQMVKFLRENASLIETKVMAPESYQFRRQMSDPILNDSVASKNLDIVAGHIYGGGLAPYPLAEQRGKEIWMTEHLTGSDNTTNPTSWSLALPVAQEITDVMQAGMSAYVWWYIVRFYGPISDGTNNSGIKGEVTKKGYVMSQFARFIRPGFYRVESSVAPAVSSVDVTAYKDPSSSKLIIVALNSSTNEIQNVFRIQNSNVISFTPYTTSEKKNCQKGNVINVVNGKFTFTLEPLSITTFVSE
ncbi:MAG: FlgD immunoglobulin-like domain containing protein [Melioribacter sp.]|uniref:FlgD immunoglobulin-like domain containing protein n=1 Tax=Rosettibacter primus TaxID=3111523 RepID=UPI00247D7C13|nr:FlgD immunoglobulin-like domain containing protein [Melioribacter sp.]